MNMRRPYVKPVVMQLHYSTEREVTIAANCKQSQSASGPTISNCRNAANTAPCLTTGS